MVFSNFTIDFCSGNKGKTALIIWLLEYSNERWLTRPMERDQQECHKDEQGQEQMMAWRSNRSRIPVGVASLQTQLEFSNVVASGNFILGYIGKHIATWSSLAIPLFLAYMKPHLTCYDHFLSSFFRENPPWGPVHEMKLIGYNEWLKSCT